MALNEIVQRALRSRFVTPQPTQSMDRLGAQLQAQARRSLTPVMTPGGMTPGAGGAGGASPALAGGGDLVDRILRTIRTRESGGNYTARNPHSTASGAYQFINGTWRGLGGSGAAWQATPAEQDRIARAYVERLLAQHGNNIEAIPATWYTGHYKGKGNLNYRPNGPGNPLTVQQYVDKWMADFNKYGK